MQPNIVLIVLDSVRRDHLSCYGHSRPTTPSIDQLAGEGVRFDAAYATSCWTVPSHASLFTGLLPSVHRADLDTQQLDHALPTLASLLTARGYRTASVSCNGFVAPYTGLTRGFDLAIDVHGNKRDSSGPLARIGRAIQRRARKLTERDRGARRATRIARKWLRQTGSEPFLLFLNYMDCHLPYALKGPARYRFVEAADRRRVDAVPMDPFAHMAGARTYSDEEVSDLKRLYDGALRYLDDQVARIRETLEEQGILERTLLIVTSDHGESFGEHGLFDHQYGLLENLIRVPLVMRGPGLPSEGDGESRLVQLTDVLPTVLDVVGGPSVEERELGLAGVSMLGPDRREWVFAEYLIPNLNAIERRFPDAETARLDKPLRVASDGRYKLVVDRAGGRSLYDLAQDPEETRDLAADMPEMVERCAAAMAQGLGPWPQRTAADAPDLTDLQERLEALGYL